MIAIDGGISSGIFFLSGLQDKACPRALSCQIFPRLLKPCLCAAQSYTLEENLARMERRGTLMQAIQAASKAHSKESKVRVHDVATILY